MPHLPCLPVSPHTHSQPHLIRSKYCCSTIQFLWVLPLISSPASQPQPCRWHICFWIFHMLASVTNSLRAQAQRQQISDPPPFTPPFDKIPLWIMRVINKPGFAVTLLSLGPEKPFQMLFTTGVNIYNFVSKPMMPDVVSNSIYTCGTTKFFGILRKDNTAA